MEIQHCISIPLLLVLAVSSSRAEVQVFILAGDSHAVGTASNAADLPPELQREQTDVLFWYDEHLIVDGLFGFPVVTRELFLADTYLRPEDGTSTWVPLKPQAEFDDRIAFDKVEFDIAGENISVGHGPEITLGNSLKASIDDEIAIIKFAWGGGRLGMDATMDWNVNSNLQRPTTNPCVLLVKSPV